MVMELPPKIQKVKLTDSMSKLVNEAKQLYREKLHFFVENHKPPAFIAMAPGRVNLIGEHTDYTGGFVFPFAIDRATVVYGTGFLHTGKGNAPTTVRLRTVSAQAGDDMVEERHLTVDELAPPDEADPRSWVNYVLGTIVQYLADLPHEGCSLDLAMAFASDVPIGAGLSSSAALEVATATFLECFMHDMAYSSSTTEDKALERALRCQKAENDWAFSPCGIMDQLVSSKAEENNFLLIDCRSLECTPIPLKLDFDARPCLVVTDSKAPHEIADSEYGLRRAQCNDALQAMQEVPLYHVLSLRDATLADVEKAKDKMEEISFKRAKHVVTENTRTKEAKLALKMGLWDRVGELMNASHASLRDDFEVSTEEIDFLVDMAQKFDGVFGSRITGGGFGGCTVTLVEKAKADAFIEAQKTAYKEKFGLECECFVTRPSAGATVLAIDMDCKKE